MRWECSIILSMIKRVKLIGCEAAGHGIDTDKHAATIAKEHLVYFMG